MSDRGSTPGALCAGEVTPGQEQKQQVPTENAQLLGWASKQCLEPLRVRQSHMAKGLGGRCKRLPTAHTLADRDALQSVRRQDWRRQPSSWKCQSHHQAC